MLLSFRKIKVYVVIEIESAPFLKSFVLQCEPTSFKTGKVVVELNSSQHHCNPNLFSVVQYFIWLFYGISYLTNNKTLSIIFIKNRCCWRVVFDESQAGRENCPTPDSFDRLFYTSLIGLNLFYTPKILP